MFGFDTILVEQVDAIYININSILTVKSNIYGPMQRNRKERASHIDYNRKFDLRNIPGVDLSPIARSM